MNGTASGLLEPCAGKLASTVLRGRGSGDAALLPDQDLGGQVRKGEKGSLVVKYGTFTPKEREDDDERAIPYLKGYTVFNGAP